MGIPGSTRGNESGSNYNFHGAKERRTFILSVDLKTELHGTHRPSLQGETNVLSYLIINSGDARQAVETAVLIQKLRELIKLAGGNVTLSDSEDFVCRIS